MPKESVKAAIASQGITLEYVSELDGALDRQSDLTESLARIQRTAGVVLTAIALDETAASREPSRSAA